MFIGVGPVITSGHNLVLTDTIHETLRFVNTTLVHSSPSDVSTRDSHKLNELTARNRECVDQAIHLSERLHATGGSFRGVVVKKLETIFGSLFKISVYIRQDYNERARDRNVVNGFFGLCTTLEKLTQELITSIDGLTQEINIADQQLVELRDHKIKNLEADVESFRITIANELESNRRQLKTAQGALEQHERALQNARVQMENAERKLQEERQRIRDAQIGIAFAWLIPPLGAGLQFGLIPKFEDAARAAQNNVNSVRQSLENCKTAVWNAQADCNRLSRTQDLVQQVASALPGTQQMVKHTLQMAEEFRGPALTMKDSIAKFLQLIGGLKNEAEVTSYSPTRKTTIARHLLEMLDTGLVDMDLLDETTAVLNELVMEDDFQKSVQNGCSTELEKVKAKEKQMQNHRLSLDQ